MAKKNKLEKLFSKSMKDQFQWGMKLHNNPLAHQTTPADYIVSDLRRTTIFDYHKFMLIEAKQVTCDENGKGRLAFKRLKQMHDMLSFQKIHGERSAFFLIGFWDKRWTNSEVYLVPVNLIEFTINTSSKVSINREEAKHQFYPFQLEIEGGILQCQKKLRLI